MAPLENVSGPKTGSECDKFKKRNLLRWVVCRRKGCEQTIETRDLRCVFISRRRFLRCETHFASQVPSPGANAFGLLALLHVVGTVSDSYIRHFETSVFWRSGPSHESGENVDFSTGGIFT